MVTRIALEQQHQKHHFGVECTLHLAQQVDPEITYSEVECVVKECAHCNSIDPAPVKWNSGHLYVDSCWECIAIDITHYQRNTKYKFLSVIDCSPSQYMIWHKINAEDAATSSYINLLLAPTPSRNPHLTRTALEVGVP